jgi:uncharacterized phiE125 gp8 family phage protein
MQHRILESAPVTALLSLQKAKNYLKVEETEDDALIEEMVEAAMEACENYTEVFFRTKTIAVVFSLAEVNAGLLVLPFGPNQQIVSVERSDTDGTFSALTEGSDYGKYGQDFLSLNVNRVWKSGCGRSNGQIRVTYTAGYDEEVLLPKLCLQAVCKLLADLYENRGDTVIGTIVATLSNNHKALLNPYRRNTLF